MKNRPLLNFPPQRMKFFPSLFRGLKNLASPRKLFRSAVLQAAVLIVLLGCGPAQWSKTAEYESLAISVPPQTPRLYALTDRGQGFYWGETHRYHRDARQGWTVYDRLLLKDLVLWRSGKRLDRSKARVEVLPDEFRRSYPGGVSESLRLLGEPTALVWRIANSTPDSVIAEVELASLRSLVSLHRDAKRPVAVAHRAFGAPFPVYQGIFARSRPTGKLLPPVLSDDPSGSGHFVRFKLPPFGRVTVVTFSAQTPEELEGTRQQLIPDLEGLLFRARSETLAFFEQNRFRSDTPRFDRAVAWAQWSLHGLVMKQGRRGIFAGLPWFNNYWGRDTFIAFEAATLLLGEFSTAREILEGFAASQLRDASDWREGRIPNLITPTDTIYNTADGTWWFVRAAKRYVETAGDTAFAQEILPVVRRAVLGALNHRVDATGFLTHGDAETWMDAVGPQGPWSPRGNRAVEIQALWYEALRTLKQLCQLTGKAFPDRAGWALELVEQNFAPSFWSDSLGYLYDHLNADGSPDRQLRPNAVLVPFLSGERLLNAERSAALLRTAVNKLTYPYGICSLSPDDPNFHPYHQYPPFYPKDAAYHNGVIWLWNAGPLITELCRSGRADSAAVITRNYAELLLRRGCAGTLPELLDAVPKPGETQPRWSGTFSQAWSLSEFVRNIFQDYLGFRFDGLSRTVILSPNLPPQLRSVTFSRRLPPGLGSVEVRYRRKNGQLELSVRVRGGKALNVSVSFPGENGNRYRTGFRLSPETWQTEAFEPARGRVVTRLPGLKVARTPRFQIGPGEICFRSPSERKDWPAIRPPEFPLLSRRQVLRWNPHARVVVRVADPVGDDRGPHGNYTYPQNPVFEPGILDLTGLEIREDSSVVYFRLKFRNLVDPGWHPEYGFQLTYAALAFHLPGAGSVRTRQVGMNAKFRLPEGWEADYLIYVGGGLKMVSAGGRHHGGAERTEVSGEGKSLSTKGQHHGDSKNTEESGELKTVLTGGRTLWEYRPAKPEDAFGDVRKKEIRFAVPRSLFPFRFVPGLRIAVLVGAQDDHGGAGLGEFRSVLPRAGEWNGGAGGKVPATNVYDTCFVTLQAPPEKSQPDIQASFPRRQ